MSYWSILDFAVARLVISAFSLDASKTSHLPPVPRPSIRFLGNETMGDRGYIIRVSGQLARDRFHYCGALPRVYGAEPPPQMGQFPIVTGVIIVSRAPSSRLLVQIVQEGGIGPTRTTIEIGPKDPTGAGGPHRKGCLPLSSKGDCFPAGCVKDNDRWSPLGEPNRCNDKVAGKTLFNHPPPLSK